MLGRRTIRDQILRLDPQRDHQRIVLLTTAYEFPYDIARALELALFRTFAVPSISALLDRTGEFQHRPQKRYDDTAIILGEILEHGYDSDRGRLALRQMNRLHSRFAITNDDFLYVLSSFIFEPMRWIDRFAWRTLTRHERVAAFYYWREIGRRMNIKHIPDDLDQFAAFNNSYEREHFRFAETNQRVGHATVDLLLGWYLPRPLRRFGATAVYALMDEPLLDAFGFPRPSPIMRKMAEQTLRLRSRIVRQLPERRRPYLVSTIRHRSYPRGYRLDKLGPPLRDSEWQAKPG
jgi:hypothetical protein